jgi:polysaccharide biosynthesis transport protein
VTPPIEEPRLRRHLRILRHKWFVIQALVVAVLVAMLVTVRQQPHYRATASVLLSTEVSADAGSTPPDRAARTAADLASMPIVAHAALRQVPRARMGVAQFLARADATPRSDSDILDFHVTDPVPARAVALATAYARSFIAVRGRLQDGTAPAALGRAAANSGPPLTVAANGSSIPEGVLVRAATSAARVEPRPIRNVALAVVLGLFGGIGLAYLWELLNTQVRDLEEVTRLLRLPLLGVASSEAHRRHPDLVLQQEPYGRAAESFRILRVNIDFANVDRRASVVLMTGAVDGEGRSTTIANLALAFALAGRDVILADLHLRHPSLHHLFGLEGLCGLSDVALGHVPLDDALAEIPLRTRTGTELGSADGSLRVLPTGPTPSDSGEFVASRTVHDLVAELRGHADLVLVDAPPLLSVGDALTLSSAADALIAVVNLDIATRPMLHELRRVLDACPTPVLGVAATGASAQRREAYGGYYAPRPTEPSVVEPVV